LPGGSSAEAISSPARPLVSRAGSVRDMIAAAAQGEAHHSGMLTKKGAKRLFVLRGTKLEWFAPDAMSNPDAQAKGQLDLSTCRVTPGANERVFVVTTGDGTAEFDLKAETANEVRAWMHVIGQVTSNAAANRAGGAPSRKGLLVHKSGGNKSRFFVLMRGHLMWMESPNLPEVIGTMPIGGASVRGDDGSAQFSVAPATDVALELVARDAAEAREWCAALRDAIKHAEQAASAKPSAGEQFQSMSGWLKKKFQRRFCTLRNDVLLWAEDAGSAPKGHLTLDGAGVYLADEIAGGVVRPNAKGGSRWAFGGSKARVGDVALSFVVTTAFGRAYTFEAATQAESNEWVRLLQTNATLASAHANAESAGQRAAATATGAGRRAAHGRLDDEEVEAAVVRAARRRALLVRVGHALGRLDAQREELGRHARRVAARAGQQRPGAVHGVGPAVHADGERRRACATTGSPRSRRRCARRRRRTRRACARCAAAAARRRSPRRPAGR
jgi:hypothetical protein